MYDRNNRYKKEYPNQPPAGQKRVSRNSYPNLRLYLLRRKLFLVPFCLLAVLLLAQFIYYWAVYAGKPGPERPELVLVYGGTTQSDRRGIALARQYQSTAYFSEMVQDVRPLLNPEADKNISITIESHARTTDQNARLAAPFIRQRGFNRIALVTTWQHEPRSLLLTRLYLFLSGFHLTGAYPDQPQNRHGAPRKASFQVVSCPNEPAPSCFWMEREFWVEYAKLWGSLLRVGLHVIGVDNWPAHS